MDWWVYVLIFLGILWLVYTFSHDGRYYIRVVWFYFSILLHAIECMITMIPSYIRGDGADLIFHTFKYWCVWTGIKFDVRGFDEYLAKNKESAVVIANHQSAIDVVSMCEVWPPRGVVMMKRSLNFVPFFNITSFLANCIFVDRFNKKNTMAILDHSVKQLLTKKHKLWVFPEGTRNHNGGLLPFKKGAFNIAVKAQIPIIPIVFSDYSPFYSSKEKYFHSDGFVIAEVMPPIETKGMTLDDVEELIVSTRESMLKVLEKNSAEVKFITANLRSHGTPNQSTNYFDPKIRENYERELYLSQKRK